ncbi:MAG: 50S ribosomal protein L18 [Chloroflexota bacterium]
MKKIVASRSSSRIKRHERLRLRISGTTERPRLAVFRSLSHIYAQVIDDVSGTTLAAASSLDTSVKGATGTKIDAAKAVGKLVAERAKAAGVDKVVFDRAGFKYHGRVRSLAEAAREAGLDF